MLYLSFCLVVGTMGVVASMIICGGGGGDGGIVVLVMAVVRVVIVISCHFFSCSPYPSIPPTVS